MSTRVAVGAKFGNVFVDAIEIDACGILRVVGWVTDNTVPNFTCRAGQAGEKVSTVFRVPRADVKAATGSSELFLGFQAEFVGDLAQDGAAIYLDGRLVAHTPGPERPIALSDTPYSQLLTTDRILGRDDIYSSGAPARSVHPEILEFALALKSPILDVGCGVGALVRELRRRGREAYGIELDRPAISEGLDAEARPFVTLYQGGVLPFEDGQFESVTAIEVIEHIPDYRQAVTEIARVCRSTFAVTVPDMSAVPMCAALNVVPWHLLESTHFNFFNAHSLSGLLRPHFPEICLYRVTSTSVGGTFVPGSVAALARRPVLTYP